MPFEHRNQPNENDFGIRGVYFPILIWKYGNMGLVIFSLIGAVPMFSAMPYHAGTGRYRLLSGHYSRTSWLVTVSSLNLISGTARERESLSSLKSFKGPRPVNLYWLRESSRHVHWAKARAQIFSADAWQIAKPGEAGPLKFGQDRGRAFHLGPSSDFGLAPNSVNHSFPPMRLNHRVWRPGWRQSTGISGKILCTDYGVSTF
jgi:hypothetical protein